MNLLLAATALLFYTKAIETKDCPKYVFTEAMTGFDKLEIACKDLNGVMASEDLKDSENAKMAKTAIDKFFVENSNTYSFVIGIHTRDLKETPHETENPFVFSDGSEFVVEGFLYPWFSNFPSYIPSRNCVFVENDKTITNYPCNGNDMKALCFVVCPNTEDENSANSGSERSREKLPLSALFVAGSVFNAFHALAGLV